MDFGLKEILSLIGIVFTVIGAFLGLAKLVGRQFTQHLDTKFEGLNERLTRIENTEHASTQQIARLERDFLNFRAELPEKYVRREDYVRGQTVIESKLDAVAIRIDKLQLRELGSK